MGVVFKHDKCPKDKLIIPHGLTCRQLCRHSAIIDSKVTGAKITMCHYPELPPKPESGTEGGEV